MKFLIGYQNRADRSLIDAVRKHRGRISEVYFPWWDFTSGRGRVKASGGRGNRQSAVSCNGANMSGNPFTPTDALACCIHLEERGVLSKKFTTPFRKRPEWKLPIPKCDRPPVAIKP